MDFTLTSYINNGSLSVHDTVKAYIEKAKQSNADFFSFVRFHDDYVAAHLDEFASRPLKAAPI